jgi:hypothetical protein
MKNAVKVLSLAFVAIVAIAQPKVTAAQDEWLDPDVSPVWVAGGSFTAELDLSSGELMLTPLSGNDHRVHIGAACSNDQSLFEGVYVLETDQQTLRFQPSFFQGEPEHREFKPALLSCTHRIEDGASLRLSADAQNLLAAFDVGAIYVHN